MNESNEWITLRQAAALSKYHADYLGSLIRGGQLKGQKFGKTWVTTEAEVRRFIEAQSGRGQTAFSARQRIGRWVRRSLPWVRRCATVLVAIAVMLGLVAAYDLGYTHGRDTVSAAGVPHPHPHSH